MLKMFYIFMKKTKKKVVKFFVWVQIHEGYPGYGVPFPRYRPLYLSLFLGFEKNTNDDCVDIDECETSQNACQHICKNEIGSFSCKCKTGFILKNDIYCTKLSSEQLGCEFMQNQLLSDLDINQAKFCDKYVINDNSL
jgi:hypothetical protein